MSKRSAFEARTAQVRQASTSTRLSRSIVAVCATALKLTYGPSECRPMDADAYVRVAHDVNAVETIEVVPVRYVITNNRGILENLA